MAKRLLSFFALAAIAALFGLYLSINRTIRAGVEHWGPQLTQTPVHLNAVRISPLSGRGRLLGLSIGNPAGFSNDNAFALKKISVSLNLKSLVSNTIIVRDIQIDSPNILYEVGLSGSNIAKLQHNIESFSPPTASSKPEKSEKPGKKVIIDHILIKNGQIRFSVKSLTGTPVTLPLPDIELRDIGKKTGGATAKEAVAAVFAPLTQAIIKAASSGTGSIQKNISSLSGSINKTLKNLFK